MSSASIRMMLGRLGALSSAMICPVIVVLFCLKFSIKQNKSIPA